MVRRAASLVVTLSLFALVCFFWIDRLSPSASGAWSPHLESEATPTPTPRPDPGQTPRVDLSTPVMVTVKIDSPEKEKYASHIAINTTNSVTSSTEAPVVPNFVGVLPAPNQMPGYDPDKLPVCTQAYVDKATAWAHGGPPMKPEEIGCRAEYTTVKYDSPEAMRHASHIALNPVLTRTIPVESSQVNQPLETRSWAIHSFDCTVRGAVNCAGYGDLSYIQFTPTTAYVTLAYPYLSWNDYTYSLRTHFGAGGTQPPIACYPGGETLPANVVMSVGMGVGVPPVTQDQYHPVWEVWANNHCIGATIGDITINKNAAVSLQIVPDQWPAQTWSGFAWIAGAWMLIMPSQNVGGLSFHWFELGHEAEADYNDVGAILIPYSTIEHTLIGWRPIGGAQTVYSMSDQKIPTQLRGAMVKRVDSPLTDLATEPNTYGNWSDLPIMH